MRTKPAKTSASESEPMAILSILRDLPDPRVERTRMHKLEDILCLAICAILCGVESFEDMEVFLGKPSRSGFRRFWNCRTAFQATTPSTVFLQRSTHTSSWKPSCAGPSRCAPPWSKRLWRWMARRCGEPSTRVRTLSHRQCVGGRERFGFGPAKGG